MKSVSFTLSLTAGLALAVASTSHAGLVFTVEGPGVQQTSVGGAKTETFDAAPVGVIGGGGYFSSEINGMYSGGEIIPVDIYGGAGGGGHYDVIGLGRTVSQTLTFGSGQSFFGLWWTAMDALNKLEFFDAGNNLLGDFQPADIIPSLTPGHRGDPNSGANPTEYYAYVNFFTTGGDLIDHVVISGGSLESDNHSVIPEPTTALFGLALLGMTVVRRRR